MGPEAERAFEAWLKTQPKPTPAQAALARAAWEEALRYMARSYGVYADLASRRAVPQSVVA